MYDDHPYIAIILCTLIVMICIAAASFLTVLVTDPSFMQEPEFIEFYKVLGIGYVFIALPLIIFITWGDN